MFLNNLLDKILCNFPQVLFKLLLVAFIILPFPLLQKDYILHIYNAIFSLSALGHDNVLFEKYFTQLTNK